VLFVFFLYRTTVVMSACPRAAASASAAVWVHAACSAGWSGLRCMLLLAVFTFENFGEKISIALLLLFDKNYPTIN
jgi:hypothetical protein